MRRKVIAGNWKMNMTPSQAVKLVTELRPNVNNPDVDVVFCVPSIDIVPVVEAVKGSNMNKVHWNSVKAEGNVPDALLREMLEKSYRLVLGSFSKKKQRVLLEGEKKDAI